MFKSNRNQLFVDRELQGQLMLRAVAYWFFGVLGLTLLAAYWQLRIPKPILFDLTKVEFWKSFGPIILLSLGFVPVLAYDLLRISHRAAGPIVRLRAGLQELALGKTPPPLNVRPDDYWKGLCDDFNAAVARFSVQGHFGPGKFKEHEERASSLVRRVEAEAQ
jgi:hypothetical protein